METPPVDRLECPTEIWKDIPGHPNYEASDFGRIRNKKTGLVLKPKASPSNGGVYWKVDLGGSKRGRNKYIHRLVALVFHGTAGEQVDHRYQDKADNRAVVLEPVTGDENRMRRDASAWNKGDSWEMEGVGSVEFDPQKLEEAAK